jgi:hypothetical protein
VTVAGVKLGSVIRKCQQVFFPGPETVPGSAYLPTNFFQKSTTTLSQCHEREDQYFDHRVASSIHLCRKL